MIRISLIMIVLVTVSAGAGQPQQFQSRDLLIDRPILQSPGARSPLSFQEDDLSIAAGKKSVPLAVLYSLLLPGMGELYVDRYDAGKYFTMAEGALWLTWGAFQLNGVWIRDDARRFAIQHAGIASIEGSDQYFIDIGNFDNVDSFNEQVLRDRDPQKVYDRNSSQAWSWDTPENRESYRELRVSSENVFNNSRYVIAAIAVNHLISAISAARLTISHNKSLNQSSTISIRTEVLGGLTHPHGIMLSVTREF